MSYESWATCRVISESISVQAVTMMLEILALHLSCESDLKESLPFHGVGGMNPPYGPQRTVEWLLETRTAFWGTKLSPGSRRLPKYILHTCSVTASVIVCSALNVCHVLVWMSVPGPNLNTWAKVGGLRDSQISCPLSVLRDSDLATISNLSSLDPLFPRKTFKRHYGFGKQEHWQNPAEGGQTSRDLGTWWSRIWQGHSMWEDRGQVWVHPFVFWRSSSSWGSRWIRARQRA